METYLDIARAALVQLHHYYERNERTYDERSVPTSTGTKKTKYTKKAPGDESGWGWIADELARESKQLVDPDQSVLMTEQSNGNRVGNDAKQASARSTFLFEDQEPGR